MQKLINTYKELISTFLNTMYKWEEKQQKGQQITGHCFFFIIPNKLQINKPLV